MKKLDSQLIFGWPEFRALAERLGVDLSLPVKRLMIDLESGNYAEVIIESFAIDRTKKTCDGDCENESA